MPGRLGESGVKSCIDLNGGANESVTTLLVGNISKGEDAVLVLDSQKGRADTNDESFCLVSSC